MVENEYQKVLEDLRKNVGVINLILGDDCYNESNWAYVGVIEYKDSKFDIRKIRYGSLEGTKYHAIRIPRKRNKFNVQLILIDHAPTIDEFIYIERMLDGDFRKIPV